MNTFGKRLLTFLFLMYIFVIGSVFFIKNDKTISKFENRNLSQKPEFILEDFIEGNYTDDFELYFSDQFPSRDRWISIFMSYELFINKTYIKGYYIDSENWILSKPIDNMNEQSIDKSTKIFNLFSEYLTSKKIETYFFIIPHKTTMLIDLYPSYLRNTNDLDGINYFISKLNKENVVVSNLVDIFNMNDSKTLKEYYFKSDHHWNMRGAFHGYQLIMETLDEYSDDLILDRGLLNYLNYNKTCYDPSLYQFLGTYNRKLFMKVPTNDNKIMCNYFNDKIFNEFKIWINNESTEIGDFYSKGRRKNNKVLTYGDLYSNDYAQIKIKNSLAENQKEKILIVKDSYANPIIPHMAQHFSETVVYDIRHNKDITLKSFIDENNFSKVIFLYNNTNLHGELFDFE